MVIWISALFLGAAALSDGLQPAVPATEGAVELAGRIPDLGLDAGYVERRLGIAPGRLAAFASGTVVPTVLEAQALEVGLGIEVWKWGVGRPKGRALEQYGVLLGMTEGSHELRERRQLLDLSIAHLAGRMGFREEHLAAMERGEREPTTPQLLTMERYLGIERSKWWSRLEDEDDWPDLDAGRVVSRDLTGSGPQTPEGLVQGLELLKITVEAGNPAEGTFLIGPGGDFQSLGADALRHYIREVRVQRGLTQHDLASYIEVSTAYISQIESGAKITVPSRKILDRFAEILGVNIITLIVLGGLVDPRHIRSEFVTIEPV